MAIQAAQLVAAVSVEGASNAQQQLQGVGDTVGKVGGNIGGILAGAAVAAGVAVVGLGVQATKMAGDFQAGMTSLVTGAGEAESNLKLVSDGILSMAVTTGTSTQQLTDGMYMIESAGFHGAAGLAVLQAAAEGAKVGNASLADVANGVTTEMTDYAKSGITAAQATNILIATVAAGKTHMADLSNAMSTILPTASAVGVGLKDVAGAMATMTGEGTDAASAATYLRQLLSALENPASKGAAALKEIGLSSQQVSNEMKVSLPGALEMITDALKKKFPEGSAAYVKALADISGGSKQMQGMLELTGDHLKVFQGNVGSITDAVNKGGNSITGWAKVQQDFNFKLDQAKEVVQTLAIKIGTALLPIIGGLLDKITPLLSGFSDWLTKSNALQNGLNFLGGILHQIADAFNAVFFPVQQVTKAAAPLLDTFDRATGIFHGTVQAVQPLTDTFDRAKSILLQTHTAAAPLLDTFDRATGIFHTTAQGAHGVTQAVNPFVPVFREAASVIHSLTPAFQEIAGIVGGVFQQHMKTAQGIVADLSTWFRSTLMPAVKQAMPGFQQLGNVLVNDVVPGLFKVWAAGESVVDKVFPVLVKVIESVLPLLVKVAGILSQGLAAAFKFLMPYILEAAQAIAHFAGDIAVRVLPIIQQFFRMLSQGVDAFMVIWKAVWPALAPILKGVWDEIVGIVKIAWALLSGLINIGLDLLSGNWGQAWEDLKTMLAGVWDGIKTYLQGAWEIISGIVQAGVQGIVHFFQWLYDTLIGHSIIPDMINGIFQWFGNLVTQGLSFISNLVTGILLWMVRMEVEVLQTVTLMVHIFLSWLDNLTGGAVSKAQAVVSGIVGVLGKLGGLALQWGQDMMNGLISGIQNMMGSLGNTVSNIAGTISSFLHFSKPDVGPLADVDKWMPDLGNLLSTGLQAQVGKIQGASLQVAHAVSFAQPTSMSGFTPQFPSMTTVAAAAPAPSSANAGQAIILQMDGRILARGLLPHLAGNFRYGLGMHGM